MIDSPTPALPPLPNVAPGAQAQAVIAPPQSMDRWTALKKVGWWKPFDSVLLALLLAHGVTGLFFLLFGRCTFNVAVIGLLQIIALLAVWAVTLAYRTMDFVLQNRAAMELLPYDSAKIAVSYLQGGQPLNTPVPR